jgi:VWFA-related protein
MRHRFRAVPLLAALALSPAPSIAQENPSFGESIDVRVVNLEAVVTDRDGHRVKGLKAGDFVLKVDGKEVPIEYFSEVEEGQALATPAAAAKPEASAPAVQGVTEGPVGTYYLVFVDDYFSIAAHRNAVLQGLKKDLGRLGPNDRMAIVAYDGGRLAMISNWSGSAADLSQALDRAMARTPHGFDRVTELRTLKNDESFAGQSTADGGAFDLTTQEPGLNDRQRVFADTLIRQVQGDVQAAVSAMRAFGGPQGRKVMLLLSGGWPFSPSSYVSGGNGIPSKELPEGDQIYAPLANTANLLGYTLYPIDVPGVQTVPGDPTVQGPSTISSFAEQEVEGSLKYLAEKTGGRALLNSNRVIGLAAAEEDTRSFYWLGFSPSWQRNDKAHSVKLEARRGGLQVRTRTGFLDLSRKAEVSMKVESALLFGNSPDALQMPMKVGEVTRSRRGEVEIPITLGLPVSLMTVVQNGKKYDAQLELRFAASDAAGNTADVPVVPVTLSSDHPPTPGKLVKYETKIHLRGKADHMVVAAYDPLSGKLATAETDLKMP